MQSISSVSTLSIGSSASSTSSKSESLLYELQDCPAKASKIEINFQSMTDREFLIIIEAPNGESSPLLYFPRTGTQQGFIPNKNGCGHGDWKIEVFSIEKYGRYQRVVTENLFADGIGSLYFLVKDDLKPVLNRQTWKHLSQNARCKKYRFFIGK